MGFSGRANKRQSAPKEPSARRFRYFVERAVLNMRQNMFVSLVTIGTIALALLIVGIFLLVMVNVENVSVRWSERVQISVYFTQELSPTESADLRSRIAALPGTSKVDYIAPAEALNRFKTRLKGQEALLEGIGADVLPAAMEVTLKRSARNHEAVERYVAQLRTIPGIGEIQYGEEWVKRFTVFVSILRTIGFLIATFLFVAVIFIVANTIRLTIYARRDELEVLALVGATRLFIKAPFLIEGIIQGACGSLVALALLSGGYLIRYQDSESAAVKSIVTDMVFLPPEYLGGIAIGGILLGFIGSVTSLRRFMKL
jgi:cell division transport system permease protein